jgi:hypothetical protein
MGFELTSDIEVYCYLKTRLPRGFTVVSEPQTAYYSEWLFHYKVFCGDRIIREYKGDFRNLEKGSLVKAARELLEETGRYAC